MLNISDAGTFAASILCTLTFTLLSWPFALDRAFAVEEDGFTLIDTPETHTNLQIAKYAIASIIKINKYKSKRKYTQLTDVRNPD